MPSEKSILRALHRTKAQVRSNDLVTGLLWLLVILAAWLLAVILYDLARPLDRAAHLIILAVLAVVAVVLAALLLWPLVHRINDLFAARLIESAAEDQFRNSLLTFVELRHDPNATAEVRAAVAAKAAHDLLAVDFHLLLNPRPRRWAVIALAALAIAAAVLALADPGNFAAALGRAVGLNIASPPATRIISQRLADAVTSSPSGEGGTSMPGEGLRPTPSQMPESAASSSLSASLRPRVSASSSLSPADRAALYHFQHALEKTKGFPSGSASASAAGPSRDAATIRSLDPQVKLLANALHQAPPDPALLAELGWNQNQLHDFLITWDNRFGPFAGTESAAPPSSFTRPAAAPLLTITGSGSTGAGVTLAPRGHADALQENIETQKRRVSPQFAPLVESYLRHVSEAETSR